MEIKQLTPNLSVAPQVTAADIGDIAAQGFKTILCNRPDGEAENQPDFASLQAAAQACDVELIYQPVSPKTVTKENVVDFSNIVESARGPVLAYCRTGTRCTILWGLGESAKGTPIQEIIATATKAGYDISRSMAAIS